MKKSNIILLSLIALGILICFSFIISVKKEFKFNQAEPEYGNENFGNEVLEISDFHSIEIYDQI